MSEDEMKTRAMTEADVRFREYLFTWGTHDAALRRAIEHIIMLEELIDTLQMRIEEKR